MARTGDSSPSVARDRGQRLWPYAVLFYIGTTWSLTVSCGKFATSAGIPPFSYTFWTMFGTAIAMGALATARGGWSRLMPAHVRYFLATGLTRVAVPNAILYVTIAHIPQGVMSILMVTGPLIVYVLALALRMERFARVRFAGLLLGLGGALLIVLPDGSLPSPDMVPWVLFAFGTPLFYSLSTLVIERNRPEGLSSTALVSGTTFTGAVFLFPAALIAGDFHVVWAPITLAELAMFAHIAITSACFVGQFELIRQAGAVFTSQQSFISAIAGMAWGILFFAERPSVFIWAALATVLAGVVLVSRRQSFKAR